MERRLQRQSRLERTAVKSLLCATVALFAYQCLVAFILPRGHVDAERMYATVPIGTDMATVRLQHGAPDRVMADYGGGCGLMEPSQIATYWDGRRRDRMVQLTFDSDGKLYFIALEDDETREVRRGD